MSLSSLRFAESIATVSTTVSPAAMRSMTGCGSRAVAAMVGEVCVVTGRVGVPVQLLHEGLHCNGGKIGVGGDEQRVAHAM